MVGHHRKHMMLDMVIHVPVQETDDGIHIRRARVQPVIQHILVESQMLRQAGHQDEKASEEGREHDEHGRLYRSVVEAGCNHNDKDKNINPGFPARLANLRGRNIFLFFGIQLADAVQEHPPHITRAAVQLEKAPSQ